jgi:hypothetical protein
VSGGLLYTKTADKELYFFTQDGVERGLAFRKDITQTTSNTTVTCATDTDFLQLTSTSPVNVTLPPGVIGKTIHISKDGAGSVTISGDSGEEFYTNSLNLTYTLNANSTVTMRFGNGYWRAFE